MNAVQSLGKSNQRKLRQFFIDELNLNPKARIQRLSKKLGRPVLMKLTT